MTNKELVNNKIERVLSLKIFGLNFEFRKGQREVVEQICVSFLEGDVSTVILDAPTGTGKSIIAMFSSRVLEELSYSGYLITSDIALQDQYEQDIRKFGLGWGNIKGLDNYICDVNKQKFSLGECKTRGISYEKAINLTCGATCGYLQNRKRASTGMSIRTDTTQTDLQNNPLASKDSYKNSLQQYKKVAFNEDICNIADYN